MTTLKIPVTNKDHIQGNINAPVTLVEYGDYECPVCGEAYHVIKRVQEHYKDKLRFVFRNFPINEIHPYAEVAAEVTEFAASFKRFWEMHDSLYENQDNLSLEVILQLAKDLKLSVNELQTALQDEKYLEKVTHDLEGGIRSGVNATPTFFINGTMYVGMMSFEGLLEVIDGALSSRGV